MNQEFVIVAVLPEPFARRVKSWHQQFDRWSKSWLPLHVTIIRPLRALSDQLRHQAASLVYPLHITWQGWQTFHNPNANVIWLDPGQDEPRLVTQSLYHDYPEIR